jgi:hypothetical protein
MRLRRASSARNSHERAAARILSTMRCAGATALALTVMENELERGTMSQVNTYCMGRKRGGRLCQAPLPMTETLCEACLTLLATVPDQWHLLPASTQVRLADKVYNDELNAWLPVTLNDAGLGRLVSDCNVLAIRREGA